MLEHMVLRLSTSFLILLFFHENPMMKSNRLAYAVLAALLSIQTLPASAAKADTASAVEASGQEAQQASDSIANYVDDQIVQGPATVDLGNQAKLKLPAKMVFVKKIAPTP